MELNLSPITPKPKLTTVISESWRLIKSHRRRFFALFIALFLICLSPLHHRDPIFRTANFFTDDLTIFPVILVGLLSETLSVFGAISVTSITLRSFNDEKTVGIKSVAKSISASFFPLVATNLLRFGIVVAVFIGFSMLAGFMAFFATLLGFQVDSSIDNLPLIQAIASVVVILPSVLVTAYLYVRWAFTTEIVVAESTWGFDALKRSHSLVNGKKRLIVSLFLIFGVSYTVTDSMFHMDMSNNDKINFVGIVLIFVAKLVTFSSLKTMVKLFNMVTNTLLYVFCKVVHDEGVSGDNQYVKLAVDDAEKVGSNYTQV